jgi:hypothetical protein
MIAAMKSGVVAADTHATLLLAAVLVSPSARGDQALRSSRPTPPNRRKFAPNNRFRASRTENPYPNVPLPVGAVRDRSHNYSMIGVIISWW